jgi:PmbA protein
MEKEYLINKSNVITLNITDGKVDSYREKEESQSTVRVYNEGKIGVAGALGNVDMAELEKQAVEKLNEGIPYPCKLNKGVKKSIIRDKAIVEETDLMRATKRMAKKVATACPRFLINGKTQAARYQGSYTNSQGTELEFENNSYQVFFQVKDKDSSNIADAYYGASLARYGKVTEDKIVNDMKTLHDAFFGEKVTLPDGKYPVIVGPYDVIGNALKDFIAEYYISGGS